MQRACQRRKPAKEGKRLAKEDARLEREVRGLGRRVRGLKRRVRLAKERLEKVLPGLQRRVRGLKMGDDPLLNFRSKGESKNGLYRMDLYRTEGFKFSCGARSASFRLY